MNYLASVTTTDTAPGGIAVIVESSAVPVPLQLYSNGGVPLVSVTSAVPLAKPAQVILVDEGVNNKGGIVVMV